MSQMDEKEILTREQMIQSHSDYRDIMPGGIEAYPFTQTRILPIIYEIPEGAKVLDIGCNSGEFMRLLAEKRHCDVTGVDVSAPVLEIAKKKGLKVVLCDADKLPFADKTFDVVTLMETLEHFNDPLPYLREIKRVLKKDGILLGSCPHNNLERHIWSDDRLHCQYYDEKGLSRDLDEVFKKSFLKVLNGTEFSMSFSTNFLQAEPVEMLFKAGGKNTDKWEAEMRKEKSLRVWFGFTQLSGTVYYRMRGFADKMHKYGTEAAYEDFKYDGTESQTDWQNRIVYPKHDGKFEWSKWLLDNFFERLLSVADLSVWQIAGNRFVLAFLHCIKGRFSKPVITEVDDWLLDMPSYNIASHPFKPNSESEWIAMEQLKLSDALIVSTQFMIDHLKEIFPGKPMHLIPNGIDFDIWDNLDKQLPPEIKGTEKAEGVIRIGYTGCGNHIGDLDLIKRPLLKLLEEFPNLEFMISNRFQVGKLKLWPDVDHPRVKFLERWILMDRYPYEINHWKMDIGVAPLRDNNFNCSKSNLRWLEYSALRIPTVASPVYPFKNSIEHGKTGLLCNSELEWYENLKSLIVDEKQRRMLAGNAYLYIKQYHDMDKIAEKYVGVLKEIKGNFKGEALGDLGKIGATEDVSKFALSQSTI